MNTRSFLKRLLWLIGITVLAFQTHASFLSDLIDELTDDPEGPNPEPVSEEQVLSTVPRIGVIGDSISDEYATYPYGFEEYNWVQFLEMTETGQFGNFMTLRNAPRYYGYEYNWARVGATTADAISESQHTGLEQQIREQWVEVAVVMIGANDFRQIYSNVYHSEWSEEQRLQFLVGFQERFHHLLMTTIAAEPKITVVCTVPDLGDTAEYRNEKYPDPERRQLVSALVDQTNIWIKQVAEENGAIVFDVYHFFKAIVAQPEFRYYGYRIDTTTGGQSDDHLFALDGFHPGTLAQSYLANMLLIMIEDERTHLRNLRQAQLHPEINPVPVEPEYRIMTPAQIFTIAGVAPSADIYFPNSIFTDPSKNVILSPWFGVLAIDQYPWINHQEHGWLYCDGYGVTQIRFWDSNLGWIRTSPETYPLFVREANQHVLRYEIGSTQPRRFFDENEQQWLEIPYGAVTELPK